ncbi:hypothetical protein E3N88_26047 [Mikania micrantha]|uniref:Uncharacterized protein n=1 Tax=Mikania micrantha TaxID=192012 RepID=A0A5N6LHF4_9ASTR|nr:hypothetical protein E3N88_42594 [Mikania micrantha]KAD4385878.1 hypothetical protein E3N88_26047 [Mikania micrantha]
MDDLTIAYLHDIDETNLFVCFFKYLAELQNSKKEGVGILKGNGVAVNKGFAVIDKAVVVMKAFKEVRVDEPGGAEPAAAEVDVRDVAAGGADVHDLDGVSGNATWQGVCGTLVYYDVGGGTFVSPNSVWFHFLCCTK